MQTRPYGGCPDAAQIVMGPPAPPWIPVYTGMTMALRRPHRGMKIGAGFSVAT